MVVGTILAQTACSGLLLAATLYIYLFTWTPARAKEPEAMAMASNLTLNSDMRRDKISRR